jgi:hypothetical protein
MDQEKITQRLVSMVWEPLEVMAKWLAGLGYSETYRGEHSVVFYNPHLNVFSAIDTEDDPNNRAVSLAFLTAGMLWPEVYPRLQNIVNQEWGRRAKNKP